VSEGEPTPGGATGSGERRTPPIGSAGEPTTAAIGSEDDPESLTRLRNVSNRSGKTPDAGEQSFVAPVTLRAAGISV
jgi:hypothetical protein